ncbi:hypothetical protein [Thalassobacterium sedimentorum]|uniref:hypothetical protein n=1 Tax=Thalassobacterium sedimentorum TaxID=3041258 RepID=UPI00281238B1|nr:hypothetical protein [Coraliomargarita sp. SDUM461004]
MIKRYKLNESERDLLFIQPIDTGGDGGWQGLLIKLQLQFNTQNMHIELDDNDLERIQRYAFDYGNGGWETRLTGIFGRHLGQELGR